MINFFLTSLLLVAFISDALQHNVTTTPGPLDIVDKNVTQSVDQQSTYRPPTSSLLQVILNKLHDDLHADASKNNEQNTTVKSSASSQSKCLSLVHLLLDDIHKMPSNSSIHNKGQHFLEQQYPYSSNLGHAPTYFAPWFQPKVYQSIAPYSYQSYDQNHLNGSPTNSNGNPSSLIRISTTIEFSNTNLNPNNLMQSGFAPPSLVVNNNLPHAVLTNNIGEYQQSSGPNDDEDYYMDLDSGSGLKEKEVTATTVLSTVGAE